MRFSAGVRCAIRLSCALCALSALPLRADATTFIAMDARDLATRAGAAVIATVTSVRAEADGNGAIVTTVMLEPEEVVLGAVPAGSITLREPGGQLGARREHIFGSAQYEVGEHVLAFLSRTGDGGWRTTAMAMGKYRIEADGSGEPIVRRSFGEHVAVFDPATGRLDRGSKVEIESLSAVTRRIGIATPVAIDRLALPSFDRAHGVQRRLPVSQHFTYLGEPSRWFEPDDGLPIAFAIDATGDAGIGRAASQAAAVDALAAWSQVDGAGLLLTDGVLQEPLPFAGCDGDTRVVFNDPFDEIDAPVDCRGVLGIGGWCRSDESRSVHGTTFTRIRLGKVTIADGWQGCAVWTACNLAEVLTHELGHAIGLGHSEDRDATMWAAPRFDGRCANLGDDDIAGLRFIYPLVATPTATPTFTAVPSATATPTRVRTSTPPAKPTRRPPGRSSVSGRIRYYAGDLPVSGASVALAGSGPAQRTTTAAGGQYSFGNVADGTWTIEPSLIGAASGAVSALDAAWVLQCLAGQRAMSEMQRTACAVSGGALSAVDAMRILELAVGELDQLPAARLCRSDWLFMPVPNPTPGQSMAMPELDAHGCRRGAVVLDPLQGYARDQNLQAAVFGDCTGNWHPDGESGNAPPAAPAGTTLEMQRLRRRPGGRWLQPIAVRAPADVHALELELRYDATTLQLGRVRALHLDGQGLLRARSSQPGRLRIAVASASPLPTDGRAVVVVEFNSGARSISPNQVRPFTATVDDRVVIGR